MISGFPLPSPPALARPPPRPAAPRRPPAAEGGPEGGREPPARPCSASTLRSGSGPHCSAGAGSRAGRRRRPCRGHGAQPAAPFRREWSREGGRERGMEGGPAEAGGDRPGGGRGLHGRGPGRAEGPSRARGGRAELPSSGGGRAAGGSCLCPAAAAEEGPGGPGQRRATAGQRASKNGFGSCVRLAGVRFSVGFHRARILDVVVCCYLPFTPTFNFIAVIKGQYLASVFSLC